jgi:hypothetical protein
MYLKFPCYILSAKYQHTHTRVKFSEEKKGKLTKKKHQKGKEYKIYN